MTITEADTKAEKINREAPEINENSTASVDFPIKTDVLTEYLSNLDNNVTEEDENVQILPFSAQENYQELIGNDTASDPVSELGVQDSIKNLDKNTKVLSTEEDDLLFSRLFPGVKRENVENDPNFKLFADGKDKSKPFCSLYGEYIALVSKIREESAMRGVVAMKNKLSSPGSLSSEESPDNSYFTREQVLKMSREQISRNYNKIRESQQKW